MTRISFPSYFLDLDVTSAGEALEVRYAQKTDVTNTNPSPKLRRIPRRKEAVTCRVAAP